MLTVAPIIAAAGLSPEGNEFVSENKDLADVLYLLGSYYTIARDVNRARVFNTAAANIAAHQVEILSGAQARKEIKGIGDSTETIIDEFLTTGKVQRLNQLESQFPGARETINYFLSFYGIGPVTAVNFYNKGYRTLEDLWFKANLTEAQRIGIMWREHLKLPIPRDEMDLINTKIGSLLDLYGIKWSMAGSYRRGEPSSNDIDVLVESRPDLNMIGLTTLLQSVLPATFTPNAQVKYMGVFRLSDEYNGHHIDIRLIDTRSWGAALMHFTGSKRFNIIMRQRAIELGMNLNEYGLFRGAQQIPTTTEEDIFAALRVQYLPPEQRTRTINTLPLL
jgi:DNA polymerase/3'-5' exonuclease PolX